MAFHVLSRKVGYATNSSSYHNMVMLSDEEYQDFKAEKYVVDPWRGQLYEVKKDEEGDLYLDGRCLIKHDEGWDGFYYTIEGSREYDRYYTLEGFMEWGEDSGHQVYYGVEGKVHAIYHFGHD